MADCFIAFYEADVVHDMDEELAAVAGLDLAPAFLVRPSGNHHLVTLADAYPHSADDCYASLYQQYSM